MSALNSLVCYSSSDSDHDDSGKADPQVNRTKTISKRKNNASTLPPPKVLKSMFLKQNNDIENPEKHDGRVRSFAHESGNWASFIYFVFKDLFVLNNFQQFLTKNKFVNWKICDDFHLSLSRTFPIAYHNIQPLVQSLKDNCSKFSPIKIDLDDCKIKHYLNDEKTRTFIGIELGAKHHKILTKLTSAVDSVVSEFGCEKYYTEASFHASLLWIPDNVTNNKEELERLKDVLSNEFLPLALDEEEIRTIDCVYCKCGNKLFQISLNSSS